MLIARERGLRHLTKASQ